MFYRRRASLLCKVPAISYKSFKAMAKTYHIYKLESEMTFNHNLLLPHSEFSHLSANKCYHTLAVSSLNCWRERVCECANSSLEREGPFWGPVGSLRALPPI